MFPLRIASGIWILPNGWSSNSGFQFQIDMTALNKTGSMDKEGWSIAQVHGAVCSILHTLSSENRDEEGRVEIGLMMPRDSENLPAAVIERSRTASRRRNGQF